MRGPYRVVLLASPPGLVTFFGRAGLVIVFLDFFFSPIPDLTFGMGFPYEL